MDLLPHSHILLWVTAAFWIINAGLGHISGRDAEPTEAKRRAVAASLRRTQGHLWLLGAVISLLAMIALVAGSHRAGFGGGIALAAVGLAGGAALCLGRTVKAYRDAHCIRSGS
jgi:hypothetical protein